MQDGVEKCFTCSAVECSRVQCSSAQHHVKHSLPLETIMKYANHSLISTQSAICGFYVIAVHFLLFVKEGALDRIGSLETVLHGGKVQIKYQY